MNKNTVASAIAVLMILGTLPASAGVIYRWQDITPNPNIGAFSGEIEFSYDVWSPGGQMFESGGGFPTGTFDPIFGVEHFYWSNPSGIGYTQHIESTMRSCGEYAPESGCESYGLTDETLVLYPLSGGGPVGAKLQLTFGSLLDGILSYNDSSTDVSMRSVGPLWTILRTGSDGANVCYSNDGRCWGSTGIWVLDLSTLPPVRVPEPSTTLLAMLAAAALLVRRKFDRT